MIGDSAPSRLDRSIEQRLYDLGFGVQLTEDRELALSDVSTESLILFAPSANGPDIDPSIANAAVPLVSMDPFVLVQLGLASDRGVTREAGSGTQGIVVDGDHPMGAGGNGAYPFVFEPEFMPWATPRERARIVAVTESGRALLFGYEAEAIAPGARARRAALLLPETASGYRGAAWVLFDASVQWALGEVPESETRLTTLFPADDLETSSLTGGSGTILLVVGDPLALTASDLTYRTRMEAMGFTVQIIKAANATAGSATGKKMVFVAQSSPNGDVLSKFLNVNVPVLVQNAGIVDDMLMTGATTADRGVDGPSTLAVVARPLHPIAAPLTGTQTISANSGGQNWGIGSSNAQNILSYPSEPTHATVFGYEDGVTMFGTFQAPDRRVLFGFGGTIPENFTNAGGDVFDRTIFWTTKTNLPPAVDAGPNQATTVDAQLPINGLVIDEEVLNPPGVSVQWSVVDPMQVSEVTFVTSPNAPATTVSFSNTGAFTLRLSASDDAVVWTTDDVVISVFGEESNQPPWVSAGPDKTDVVNGLVTLDGWAWDEGLPNPPGALSLLWTQVSGPGTVTFGSPTEAVTTVSSSQVGTYVLRLTANDCDPLVFPSVCSVSGGTSYDDVVVSVQEAALLIVADPNSLTAADTFVKSRIEALGFPVVAALPPASAAAAAAQSADKAFVWIAHSAPNASVAAKFKSIVAPVVVEASGILDDMSMTTASNLGGTANQTQGVIPPPPLPPSPLSAGVVGTFTANTTAINHSWGIPGSNGIKVVTLVSNPNRATVFSYEMSVGMIGGFAAPERRVFFGMWAFETPTYEATRIVDATILWVGRTNAAPWPNAGPDLSATLSGGSIMVSLAGSWVDDGLPTPAAVTTTWSLLSGPALVTFGNDSTPSTTATFTVAGDYVLQLTARDGALSRSDTARVTVQEAPAINSAPTVAAGPDRTVKRQFPLSLNAIAADDGLPNTNLTYAWTKVSGPGNVTFGTPSAKTTTAQFAVSGVYVIRVTVNDGAASASDDLQVTVEEAATALLVVGVTSPLSANDSALKARLEQQGMSVTVKGNGAVPNDLNNKVVAVISDTVSSTGLTSSFRNALRDTATPVLCQEPQLYDDMKMTGTVNGLDYGTHSGNMATILNSSHVLAARLSGVILTHTAPVNQVFGVPSSSAIKIAVNEAFPTRMLVFGYAEGVAMAAGFAAPGRRVGMMSEASSYTTETWLLFDSAVKWLSEKPVPTLLVTGSTLTASDQALLDNLLTLEYSTTVIADTAVSSASTLGKALVIIAPSADPVAVGTDLREVAVPVITMGAGNFPNMGLTGGSSGLDYGTIPEQTTVAVTNPLHPMGVNLFGEVKVLDDDHDDSFSWGVPASNAEIVSTLALDPGKATTFGYDAGDPMIGVSAPERRVAIWLGPNTAQNLSSTQDLIKNGPLLRDAAIAWAFGSDGDRDGLGYLEEFRAGTNPADPDSNDDGILDGASVDSGISPTTVDVDGDGLTNAQELAKGTDPFRSDTDGDNSNDATDCYPLDPAASACGSSITGPPGITLTEPTNAQFVSSVCTPPTPCPP